MAIRSTKELVYEPVNGTKAVIALRIKSWERETQLKRFKIFVEDCIVADTGNTEVGAPLKSYTPINLREVYRSDAQVNGLFEFIAIPIMETDVFSDKIDFLFDKALALDTQSKPVYGTLASDWEEFNEVDEVVI
jgi:hypothetical protein